MYADVAYHYLELTGFEISDSGINLFVSESFHGGHSELLSGDRLVGLKGNHAPFEATMSNDLIE